MDYMVSGLYNFISKIQHRLLYQTTKTVLRTFLFVVAAFYFESKGSLGRVESINIYQHGKIGVADLFSPSSNALPFASCTTTLVNSSAHSNPSPPGRPGVKSVRCCLGSQQHGTSSCACDQVLEWEMGESCWFPSMTDHQAARQNLKVSNFNKCMSLKISVTFYVAVSHWLTIQG